MGNYLFCCKCVHMRLGISYQRLARQRKVKQSEYKNPMKLKKMEVNDKYFGQYVVMPQDVDLSFIQWWIKFDNTAEVSVCFTHECHGLAGNTSNNAKLSVKEQFLNFVDISSQPNGRSADSSSATHYFLPKFRTVQLWTTILSVSCRRI